MKWLSEFMLRITSVCAAAAVVECIALTDESSSSFRLVCGAVVTAITFRSIFDAMQTVF